MDNPRRQPPPANGNGAAALRQFLTNEQFGRFEEVIGNALMSRTEFFRNFMDPRRDIDKECGYPAISSFQGEQYFDLYDREPIARRVAELMAKESWLMQPSVFEDSDPNNVTEFEEAWDALDEGLHNGTQSHFKPEEGSIVWEFLARIDEQSGIGSFGVLLMGFDDGKTLDQPVDGAIAPTINHSIACGVEYTNTGDGGRLIANADGEEVTYRHEKEWIEGFERRHDLAPVAVRNAQTWNALPGFPGRKGKPPISTKPPASKVPDPAPTPKPGTPPIKGMVKDGAPKDITGVSSTSDVIKDIYGKAGGTISDLAQYDVQGGGEPTDVYGGTLPKDQLAMIGVDTSPSDPSKGEYGGAGPAAGSMLGTDRQYMPVQFTPPLPGPDESKPQPRRLLFLRPIPEHMVQVVQYEADIRNPRFGQPIMYLITLNDPRQPHTGIGLPLATVRVHWSRVIHVADNLTSSEIFGTPRMKPVLNPLLDVKKVRGAAAEGYWQSCFTALSFETHPQLGGDVAIDKGAMKEDIENFMNGLQRYLSGVGGGWKTLAPTVVDPTPHIDKLLEAICIQLGCPLRVFKGAERGELASTQDDDDWNTRVNGRRTNYVTPRIIVPFVDRLIAVGVLPEPAEGYKVEWPDIESLGKAAKATIANTLTTAITTYVQSGGEQLIPPMEFLTKILGLEEEEAQAIVDAAEQAQAEADAENQALADEHGMVPQIEGFQSDPAETPITLDAGQSAVHPDDVKPGSPSHAKHKPAPEQGAPPPKFGGKGAGGPPGGGGFPPRGGKVGPPQPPQGWKPQGKFPVKNEEEGEEEDFAANFNTNHDDHGRFSSEGGEGSSDSDSSSAADPSSSGESSEGVKLTKSGATGALLDLMKGAADKVGHIEHVAKEWAQDKVEEGIAKLPTGAQKGVRAAIFAGKAAMGVLFAGYTAAQSFSEKVAKENGLSDQQAKDLRGTLSKVDLGTFEVFKVGALAGIHAAHAPALFTGMVPVASASYLAYSTAKNPVATYKAAKGLVSDGASKLGELTKSLSHKAYHGALGLVGNELIVVHKLAGDGENKEDLFKKHAWVLTQALKAHGFSDWYQALLSASLDETGDGRKAIILADALYQQQSTDPSDQDEAVENSEAVLNVFCPTGLGGGVNATCSPGGAAGGKAVAGAFKEALTAADKGTFDKIREHILSQSKVKRGGLGVAGLKTIAKELGIKGHTAFKKEQLIQAVYEKMGVHAKDFKSTINEDKGDRMHRVALAEVHTGIKFEDRVLSGLMTKTGVNQTDAYKEAMRDVAHNGPAAKGESIAHLKAVRENTLKQLSEGKITDDQLKDVLRIQHENGHGSMSVDEFKKGEHRVSSVSYKPKAAKAGEVDDDIGLAPAERGTLWKKEKKDLGYIERIDRPAFDRLQEIKKAEKDTGKTFKDKVLDELLTDGKVHQDLPSKDRDKYRELQDKGKLSEADTRFIKGFRAAITSRIKFGDVKETQVVDALERLSDKGHGTLRLDEYNSLLGGKGVDAGIPKDKKGRKKKGA